MYYGASLAMRHDLVAVTLNDRLAKGGSLYLGHLDPEFSTSGNRPHFPR
jgi:carboxylesterase type B